MERSLTPMPPRIAALLKDPERGYPVPWFVQWINGKPEFRIADSAKRSLAIRHRLCWVCGETLGVHFTFVLGPMCGITRTTAEPPCHLECARWSVQNCPFLVKPQMERRGTEEVKAMGAVSSGRPILRNPGVALLWTTRGFRIMHLDHGHWLISVHPAESMEWWAEGRKATSEEIEESIRTGLPKLEEAAREDGPEGQLALQESIKKFRETAFR